MIIENILLEHFRNYVLQKIEFHPKVNILFGDNAQGKTNLLEAIAYLSSAHSYRAKNDSELIQFEENHAYLRGEIKNQERNIVLEVALNRGGRRQLCSNGVKMKTLGELSGLLDTVLFCPEDLHLIREGAYARRRYLDECISQLRPKYAIALSEYKKLYEHKTRILRDSTEYPDLLRVLDDFSLRMAQYGAILIHYRAYFIKKLNLVAPEIHSECSGNHEVLSLQYETVSTITDPEAPTDVLFYQLCEHQKSHKQAEIESRSCLSGPHKDDLIVEINGKSAKSFASQGQTRTAALTLKLATRNIFFQDTGEWPVLLMDDVLSELDEQRQEYVINQTSSGQVFISCCDKEKLGYLKEGNSFQICNGKIIQ